MKNSDIQLGVQGTVRTLIDDEGYLVRQDRYDGRTRYPLEGAQYTAGAGLALTNNQFSINYNDTNSANKLVKLDANTKIPSGLYDKGSDIALTFEDNKTCEVAGTFMVNLNGSSVQRYATTQAVSTGAISIGITGTAIANTCTTLQLMIPYTANISTITLPSGAQAISIPTTIQYDNTYTYNYAVFVIRKIGEELYINFSYKYCKN